MRVESAIVRKMLEAVEAAPGPELAAMPPVGEREDVATYHLEALISGGYLTAKHPWLNPRFRLSLTLAGQRLLDELRSPYPLARVVGDSATRILTSLIIGILLAKARAAGMTFGI